MTDSQVIASADAFVCTKNQDSRRTVTTGLRCARRSGLQEKNQHDGRASMPSRGPRCSNQRLRDHGRRDRVRSFGMHGDRIRGWEQFPITAAFTRHVPSYCAVDLDKTTISPLCVPLLEPTRVNRALRLGGRASCRLNSRTRRA